MTKLISLVEQKNADGFRTAIEEKLAQKVADVLDGLKPIVAQKFFAGIAEDAQGAESGDMSGKTTNVSNECEPGPGKGQAPDAKGGFASAQSKAKKMPAAGGSQGMPGK